MSCFLAAYYIRAIVGYFRIRSYSNVQKGTAAQVEEVGMSRGIDGLEVTVGDKSRETVVGIDEIVDVQVSNCEGWGLLMQLRRLRILLYHRFHHDGTLTYLMSNTCIMNLPIFVLICMFCPTQ